MAKARAKKETIAPRHGYGTDQKQKYRERVWSILGPAKTALLMPSRILDGADEIDVAIQAGVPVSGIYQVDGKPANVALNRHRYPSLPYVLGAHGVMVSDAARRLAKAGVTIEAANLDLTSCASLSSFEEIDKVCCAGVFRPGAKMAVALLRGRESGLVGRIMPIIGRHMRSHIENDMAGLVDGLDALTDHDVARICFVLAAMVEGAGRIEATPRLVAAGVYASKKQTMLWCAAKLYRFGGYRMTRPGTQDDMRADTFALAMAVFLEALRDLRDGNVRVKRSARRRAAREGGISEEAIVFMHHVRRFFGLACRVDTTDSVYRMVAPLVEDVVNELSPLRRRVA